MGLSHTGSWKRDSLRASHWPNILLSASGRSSYTSMSRASAKAGFIEFAHLLSWQIPHARNASSRTKTSGHTGPTRYRRHPGFYGLSRRRIPRDVSIFDPEPRSRSGLPSCTPVAASVAVTMDCRNSRHCCSTLRICRDYRVLSATEYSA
jgi:hypothetical protein